MSYASGMSRLSARSSLLPVFQVPHSCAAEGVGGGASGEGGEGGEGEAEKAEKAEKAGKAEKVGC